jgi:hypothetical protein
MPILGPKNKSEKNPRLWAVLQPSKTHNVLILLSFLPSETHRTVLNQILRQSTTHLADGPFAVLVDYIRVLDFDVKRKYVPWIGVGGVGLPTSYLLSQKGAKVASGT